MAIRRAGARNDPSKLNPTKKVSCFVQQGTKSLILVWQKWWDEDGEKENLEGVGKQKLRLHSHSLWLCAGLHWSHSQAPTPRHEGSG